MRECPTARKSQEMGRETRRSTAGVAFPVGPLNNSKGTISAHRPTQSSVQQPQAQGRVFALRARLFCCKWLQVVSRKIKMGKVICSREIYCVLRCLVGKVSVNGKVYYVLRCLVGNVKV